MVHHPGEPSGTLGLSSHFDIIQTFEGDTGSAQGVADKDVLDDMMKKKSWKVGSQWSHSCWWKLYEWGASDNRWNDQSSWGSSSWDWTGRRLQPAVIPVEQGDKRFAPKKIDRDDPSASRVYICDACGSRNPFKLKSMHFDGQYVDVLAVKGRSVAELERACWAGEVNATWHCTKCHQRHNENIEDTRIRIGVYDTDRMERTRALICRGFRPQRKTNIALV